MRAKRDGADRGRCWRKMVWRDEETKAYRREAYLGCGEIEAACGGGGDVVCLGSTTGGKLADAMQTVVGVSTKEVSAVLCEGIGLSDELEGGAGVGGEDNGVAWGSIKKSEDGLACLGCTARGEGGTGEDERKRETGDGGLPVADGVRVPEDAVGEKGGMGADEGVGVLCATHVVDVGLAGAIETSKVCATEGVEDPGALVVGEGGEEGGMGAGEVVVEEVRRREGDVCGGRMWRELLVEGVVGGEGLETGGGGGDGDGDGRRRARMTVEAGRRPVAHENEIWGSSVGIPASFKAKGTRIAAGTRSGWMTEARSGRRQIGKAPDREVPCPDGPCHEDLIARRVQPRPRPLSALLHGRPIPARTLLPCLLRPSSPALLVSLLHHGKTALGRPSDPRGRLHRVQRPFHRLLCASILPFPPPVLISIRSGTPSSRASPPSMVALPLQRLSSEMATASSMISLPYAALSVR